MIVILYYKKFHVPSPLLNDSGGKTLYSINRTTASTEKNSHQKSMNISH